MKQNSIKHLISMYDLNRFIIESLFDKAELYLTFPLSIDKNLFRNKKLGIMFFQNSTRTRLSFEAAMLSLGGNVLGFSDHETTRSGDFFKESLEDATQVISQMVDCIVLRHYQSFAAKIASSFSSVPIINAGDGNNEHPTQTLVDLWTIKQYMGTLDGLIVGIMGILTTRTIRSLIIGLAHFKTKKFIFLQPGSHFISEDILTTMKQLNIIYEFYDDILEVLKEVDVLYLTPVYLPDFEKKNFTITTPDFISTPNNFQLTKRKFQSVGRNIPVLHCGPRLDELSPNTDLLPQSMYFKQVKNSVYLRMAILDYLISDSENIFNACGNK